MADEIVELKVFEVFVEDLVLSIVGTLEAMETETGEAEHDALELQEVEELHVRADLGRVDEESSEALDVDVSGPVVELDGLGSDVEVLDEAGIGVAGLFEAREGKGAVGRRCRFWGREDAEE